MPDLLSDFSMPSSYRQVAVSRITNTATLYSNGSANTGGIVEVVGSDATTDLSLAVNESVSSAAFASAQSMLTLFAARGVRDSSGKWGNFLRISCYGNTAFNIDSVVGNGHADTNATPILINLNVAGVNNVKFNQFNTEFNKNVIFNGDVQIAGYQKVVYGQMVNAASTVHWIPLNYFDQVPEAIYVGRIELFATDASNNYLIWSSVGTLLFSRTNQEVYGASPGNLLSVNWFSHHRTIAMPTVEYIPGAQVSPGYNYGTLRLTFPQAVKATINFSLKRLM